MTWTLTCQGEVIHVLYFPLQQLNTRCFSFIVFSCVISIWFLKFGLIIFFAENMQLQPVKTGTSGMS